MKVISRRYVLGALFSCFLIVTHAQPQIGDATLQINAGGHLAQISESIVTSDGKYIITTSTDKTVCIWDAVNKKLVDQIRGAKSVFNQGKLYSVAISPDNRFLAVGGFLAIGTETDGDLAGQIRIYDFASRKQVLRLKAHTNVVTALRFSGDSKFLFSGAYDDPVIAWKISGPVNKPSFTISKKIVRSGHDLEDIQTFGNTVLVTEENQIVTYSLPSMIQKGVSKNYKGRIISIAVNSSKNRVVITSNRKEMVILDTTLKELQVISLNESSPRCAISPNGQFLVAEGKDSKADFFIQSAGNYRAAGSIDFPGGNTVLGMGFLGNSEFYLAGGPLNILQFYAIKENALTIADVNPGVTLSGAGRTFTGIAVHDKNLALNDAPQASTNSSAEFKYIFNAEAGRLQNFVVADSLLYPLDPIERDSIRISVDSSGTEMYIYTHDSVTGTIRRDGGNGYQHVCATVTTKHQVISGSAAGFLNLYNNQGAMLAAFIGHEGDVKSIQETKDGNFLFSTSLDKTIRMWDLRQVKNRLSFRTYTELENEWKQFISKYYPAFDSTATNPIEKLYNEMMNEGSEASAANAAYLIMPQYIEPRLNIFIAENKEWVIWNNKGYFKASGNGAAYIGWYVYKGEDADAEFYTADKLYDNYYRPDIINRLLFSTEYAADILRNSKDVSELSIAEQVSNMPVLRLEKLLDTARLTEKNINLKFSVDNKEFLGDVLLYQNGKRVTVNADMIRGLKVGAPGIPVELVTGENLFVASVLNKNKVESTPIKFKLTYIGARPSSNLYILAVGVDHYKNNRYNLNYAKADASGIVQQLSGSAKTIFKNIQVDTLFDEEATVENLTGKMELLQKKIKPEDVFLFFFAGHGIMNDPVDATKPDFYLVLHKVTQMTGNETMLKENALSATGLKDLLLKIPAQKQLVLLDACNSGGAITTLTRGGPSEEAAIFQLARSTGFTVLSSTSQEQFASEMKALGHGLFTYALLNGLNGEADLKKDGKITVKEIELYINEVIPSLSEKYKGAQQFPQSFSRGMDFPLTIKHE